MFMIFQIFQIGDIFGINTDLRIDPNSIPHTGSLRCYNRQNHFQFHRAYLALELNGSELRTKDLFSLRIGGVEPQWGQI